MRRLALSVLLCLAATVSAKGVDDISQLLTDEVPFTVADGDKGGLARVELNEAIVKACRPDLSDLRIFDAADHELPFVVYSFEAGVTKPEQVEKNIELTPTSVQRDESPARSGPPLRKEVYTINLPTGGPWLLQLDIAAPEFVAKVDIDAQASVKSGPVYQPLVTAASVFRLPQHGHTSGAIELPATPSTLRVTLTSQSQSYLEPRFRITKTETYSHRKLTVPLTITSTRRENHKTILDVRRPGALMPLELNVLTTTSLFDREVNVFAIDGKAETRVANARIFRVHALGDVESRSIPINRQTAELLRIEIDDQDSPPLADIAVSAVIANPVAVFARTGSGTIRYGGGRAYAPHYDVANMAELRGLFDVTQQDPVYRLPAATLGASRHNPRFSPSPLLAFAMRAGGEVDVHGYSHRRALQLTPSADGLSRFTLDASDLAVAKSDVTDVRIVDGQSHQWPYIIERKGDGVWQRIAVTPSRRNGTASTYTLQLPVTPLVAEQLRIDPSEPFFDRQFSLVAGGADGNAETTLASGRFYRHDKRPGDARLPDQEIGIQVNALRAKKLQLTIEDGENAALHFDHVDAYTAEPIVYVVAPAGNYSLLIGNAEDNGPAYDIASVRDEILAVTSQLATPGPLVANPDFTLTSRLASEKGKATLFLWLALGVAVIVLAGFTLRMAKRA